MKRIVFAGVSALALGGCSWLGLGEKSYDHAHHAGAYAAPAMHAHKSCSSCQPRLSRINLEGGIGPSFLIGGDAITGSDANFVEGVTLNDVSMNDAYDTGIRGELGASYALAPNTKVVGMGHYVQHDGGDRVELGTQNGVALSGELTDYTAYGAELGLRQYGNIRPAPIVGSVRPYIEGRVGASKIEDIFLRNSTFSPNADVGFYDSRWAATGAGLVGVETPFVGNSTLGLETGIRYTDNPRTENRSSLVPGNPLAGINNGGDKWSVPLMLRGRYRF